jgi:hypothetical protein
MNLRLDLIWEIKMSVIDVENASLQLNFSGNQLLPRKHFFPQNTGNKWWGWGY